MRKYTLLLAAFLLLVLGSCHKESAGPFTLGIDLQSAFQHDYVTVQLDGVPLYQDTITTNQVLGLAASVGKSPQVKGAHTITMTINNAATKTFSFNLEKDTYIALGYNPQTVQIMIGYSDTPYLYD